MEWISVNDRLPTLEDAGECYLAYTPEFNEAEHKNDLKPEGALDCRGRRPRRTEG